MVSNQFHTSPHPPNAMGSKAILNWIWIKSEFGCDIYMIFFLFMIVILQLSPSPGLHKVIQLLSYDKILLFQLHNYTFNQGPFLCKLMTGWIKTCIICRFFHFFCDKYVGLYLNFELYFKNGSTCPHLMMVTKFSPMVCPQLIMVVKLSPIVLSISIELLPMLRIRLG